jgi:hypothetical protein
MEWLKSISWLKILGLFTSLVVYVFVFCIVGALFLTFTGVGVSVSTMVSVVFIGAFMGLGRDVLAKPLSQVAQNIVTGVPWSTGILPPPSSEDSKEE